MLIENWPPDYRKVWGSRQKRLEILRSSPRARGCAAHFYAAHPQEFIEDWVCTYDPRNADGGDLPATLPFILFPKQRELVTFLYALMECQADGLVEKSRDMGATWIAVAVSVHLWLYRPGASVGWGSRKEQLVDKIGDPDSIFEKIRMVINSLPVDMKPMGLDPKKHLSFMKIVNPINGATITGEAGDNIGRGGRKLIYFKDESAHYERPERIEAALSDNTRVQVDISSVNGIGNVFHRRREAGVEWSPGRPINTKKTNVFVMDWSDHPAKDRAWYDKRRAKAVEEGLFHIFAQEVDRDYSASVEGIVIDPAWVRSAIDAHKVLGFEAKGPATAGLDVADEGLDRNALVIARGNVVQVCKEWGERDTGKTTRRAIDACLPFGPLALQYDSIGVGSGVKAEQNRLSEEVDSEGQPLLPKGITLIPWNAAASVLWPDKRVVDGDRNSPLNQDFYSNLKAQAWWQVRRRFEKTHRAITEGIVYPHDELISLPSDLPGLRQLQKELSQATVSKGARMKLVIDKAPEGTRSPNMADALVMAYWPANQGAYDASLGWV